MNVKWVMRLWITLLLYAAACQCHAQSEQARPDTARSPARASPDPSSPLWPGFGAPAQSVVEFFLFYREDQEFFDALGMRMNEFESCIAKELEARPMEFAAALLAVLPQGFSAWKAIELEDEEWLRRLTQCRVLPLLASQLPPDLAQRTISELQNQAARLGRIGLSKIESKLRRPIQDEDFGAFHKPEYQDVKYLFDCVFATAQIDQKAVRAASRVPAIIQPYMVIWPRTKSDQEKRRAVAAKYSRERTKYFEKFPPLREDEIVFLRRNVDRFYDLDWYRVNREKFDGMTAQEIALKVWEMSSGERTPFWPSYSLEEFFDGNTYDDSIAPNLMWDHPGIETFYYVLRRVRAMPGVLDVRITRHPDSVEGPDGGWMSANQIVVWTRGVEMHQVLEWLQVLKVTQDWIGEVREGNVPLFGPPLEDGVRVFMASWD